VLVRAQRPGLRSLLGLPPCRLLSCCNYCCRAIARKLAEVGAPRVVDQIGVTAEALEKGFDVGGIGAKLLGDNLGQIGCILLTQSFTSVSQD